MVRDSNTQLSLIDRSFIQKHNNNKKTKPEILELNDVINQTFTLSFKHKRTHLLLSRS